MFSRWKKKGGLILAAVLMFTQLGSMGCGKAVYASEEEAAILQDANFTGSLWDDGIWTVSPSTWDNVSFSYFTYADDEWMATESEEGTSGFKFWMANGGEYTLTQWVDSLPAGTYTLTSYVMGSGADVSLKVNDSVSDSVSLAGYNQWQKVSATFEVSEDGAGATVGFDVDVATDGWGYLDQLSMAIKSGDDEEDIPEDNPDTGDIEVEPVESDIYVEHVALSDDFITGADISSYLSLVDSGAKFYDFDGNELDKQGFFNFLADNGTNWVRIRVWNNPYDASGNGYGGGNNDLAKAIRESHEFKKLKEAKTALDPQGKEMADKFIRLNMEAQIAQSQGKEPDKAVTDEIQNVYRVLSLNSTAMDYLNSFMRFNMMMNDVMKNIESVIKKQKKCMFNLLVYII